MITSSFVCVIAWKYLPFSAHEHTLCYQVCERPVIHLLDTPGVLPPKIENIETGMKLALCGKIV